MGDLVAFALLWSLGWLLLWRLPRPTAVLGGGRPAVTIVVPARDEAAALPVLLASLVPQLAPGDELVVVDDASTDATAEAAAAGGVTVVPAPPLPDGWSGKSWACATGARVATTGVLVFLDADVRLAPGGLDRIVAEALGRGGLYSVQPSHLVPRAGERLAAFSNLVALMGTGAFAPVPVMPRGAFGPCLVTTVGDYRRAGGHEAVRASVVDDLALADRYRAEGLAVTLRQGRGAISFRMYPSGVPGLVEGFTKNLAAGARGGSPPAVLGVAGWLAACCAPLVLATRLPGPVALAAYALVALQVGLQLRRIGGFGVWPALVYPVALAVFLAIFARSTVLTLLRRPIDWKGRPIST